MSFKEINEVKFELNETTTLGAIKFKHGRGYCIPVTVDDETSSELQSIAKQHNAKILLYENTLYFKALSKKSKLLNNGDHIRIHFKVTHIYTKDDVNHLIFNVTKFQKIDKPNYKCPSEL